MRALSLRVGIDTSRGAAYTIFLWRVLSLRVRIGTSGGVRGTRIFYSGLGFGITLASWRKRHLICGLLLIEKGFSGTVKIDDFKLGAGFGINIHGVKALSLKNSR